MVKGGLTIIVELGSKGIKLMLSLDKMAKSSRFMDFLAP